MKEIVDKVITEVAINKEADMLRFTDDNGGFYIYHADADCCSESWLQDFEGSIVGKKVAGFEEGKVEQFEDKYGRQGWDQKTPFIIHTNDGDFKFSLINSSNGYYSGWLSYGGNTVPKWANGTDSFRKIG